MAAHAAAHGQGGRRRHATTDHGELVACLIGIAETIDASPATVVAVLAETIALRQGATLRDRGLRLDDHLADDLTSAALFERTDAALDAAIDAVAPPAVRPELLGQVYERLLDPVDRTRRGAHLTSAQIATGVVSCLEPDWLDHGTESRPPVVFDPAVGGAAFLLAAAQAMVEAGWSTEQAWAAQRGSDIDPGAVAVAEAALALWMLDGGHDPAPHPGLQVGDGLLGQLPSCDVVVGNPPFLTQLRGGSAASAQRRDALRDRWGGLVGAYTDESWLFLAAGLDAVHDGGQVVMIQPLSVLAARHASPIRHWLHERGRLSGLWVANARVFDANVQVCAPALRKQPARRPDAADSPPTRRWTGADFASTPDAGDVGPDEWGRVGASLAGVPAATIVRTGPGTCTVADLASVTAGFRDQFYGFAPFVSDAGDAGDTPTGLAAPLVTVGMIDPVRLRWGSAEFRFAGSRYISPMVDCEALRAADPGLAEWASQRRIPKVLIATQTKMIEAWADVRGETIPATPVISVEPHASEPHASEPRVSRPHDTEPHASRHESESLDLFRLVAAVSAPVVTADLASAVFGTALSVGALKVSATDVASIPLPTDEGAWRDAALRLRDLQNQSRPPTLAEITEIGHLLSRCHQTETDVDHDGLVAWWSARWPQRTDAE